MRLSIGFTFLLVGIAFVQSNPLFNGLGGQFGNVLSSGQFQSVGQDVFQLLQNVLNGQLDANELLSQIQQLFNLSGLGLTRPALNGGFQVEDLQNLLAQYPQYAGLVNQAASIASQVLPLFSSSQLNSLQKLVLAVAQKVVSGQLSVSAAASQLLGAIQPVLASNADLFNQVQSFVQQVIDAAQTILSSNVESRFLVLPSVDNLVNLVNQFNPSELQALLDQYPQYAGLVNQATDLARRVLAAVSVAQVQSFVNLARQLVRQVVSGQLSVSAAVNQLSGAVQPFLASNAALLNDVQSFVQQVLNLAQSVFPNTESRFIVLPSVDNLVNLANQFKPSDLQGLLSQYPQYAALLSQIAALASQVTSAVSQNQLQPLGQLAFQLAQDVFNGNLDANAAASQLLAELQEVFGSNTPLYNAVANVVQQLLSLTGNGLTRPAILSRQFSLNNIQSVLNQYPQYASLVAPLTALAQQVVAGLSQTQLSTVYALVLQLGENVVSGQLGANEAASQLLTLFQEYFGSNPQLYSAVANAVQQLLNLTQE